jgi:hypothetical protein
MYRDHFNESCANHDRASCEAETLALYEDGCIEQMMGDEDLICDFVAETGCKAAIRALTLFIDRGIPSANGSEREDALHIRLHDLRESIRGQFETWARNTTPNAESKLQKYMREQAVEYLN